MVCRYSVDCCCKKYLVEIRVCSAQTPVLDRYVKTVLKIVPLFEQGETQKDRKRLITDLIRRKS